MTEIVILFIFIFIFIVSEISFNKHLKEFDDLIEQERRKQKNKTEGGESK